MSSADDDIVSVWRQNWTFSEVAVNMSTNHSHTTITAAPNVVFPLPNALYYTLELALALLAIGGNAVILAAYFCNRRLRIIPHYHLISLAISDFMMGAVAIPIWVAALQGFPYSYPSCLFALSMVLFIDLASVFSLLMMTIDRYIFICWPLRYEVVVTSRRTIVVIIISWILSITFVLPMPLRWNLGTPALTQCFFMSIVAMDYLVFVFFTCIVPPIIAMTAMYFHILSVVRKQVSLNFIARSFSLFSYNSVAKHRTLSKLYLF